jgi:hypothetical protein
MLPFFITDTLLFPKFHFLLPDLFRTVSQIELLCFVIFERIFFTRLVSCSLKIITRPIRTTINLAPVFFMPQKPYKHWI